MKESSLRAEESPIIPELTIPTHLWIQMIDHLNSCLPEEGCGLIGGRNGRSRSFLPVTNSLHSPVRFRMDPTEQIEAIFKIEGDGDDLLAIMHSHPSGPSTPSAVDIAENRYPGVVHLIFFREDDKWAVRGSLMNGDEIEISIAIVGGESS